MRLHAAEQTELIQCQAVGQLVCGQSRNLLACETLADLAVCEFGKLYIAQAGYGGATDGRNLGGAENMYLICGQALYLRSTQGCCLSHVEVRTLVHRQRRNLRGTEGGDGLRRECRYLPVRK